MKLSFAPPILKHGGGGEGVEVIWTKSKRTATFFSGNLPKLLFPLLPHFQNFIIDQEIKHADH